MSHPLQSLMETGTKLWLDSIDPDLVRENRGFGATGATSNPVIISDLIRTGRFDDGIRELLEQGLDDGQVAWQLTDRLVGQAQAVFRDVWDKTQGDDGYVSFELDPLLEDPQSGPPHAERVRRYIELGKQWAAGNPNRMIKVPATPAGLDSLEELAAAGVSLNVTLIFTANQYRAARSAVWAGAQRRDALDHFKSVYSIFVSRVDVYTDQHATELSAAAQGQVGIVNAKRIWQENVDFWKEHPTPLQQEIIFASTGTKKPEDPPWKYVAAFAGGDIQTNPPATNQAVAESGKEFVAALRDLPSDDVLADIDAHVDPAHMEEVLMREGIRKFADPQKMLLSIISEKRAALAT